MGCATKSCSLNTNKNFKQCGKNSTTAAAAVEIGSKQQQQHQQQQQLRNTEHNSPPPPVPSEKDTARTSIGLAHNSQSPIQDYLAAGAGIAVAGRKIDLASEVLSPSYSWEMQRLHFTAGLSSDLEGGVLFETGFQDPPEEGEAEEPW